MDRTSPLRRMTASPLLTSTNVQPLWPMLSPILIRRVTPSILNKAADLLPNSSNPSRVLLGATAIAVAGYTCSWVIVGSDSGA